MKLKKSITKRTQKNPKLTRLILKTRDQGHEIEKTLQKANQNKLCNSIPNNLILKDKTKK